MSRPLLVSGRELRRLPVAYFKREPSRWRRRAPADTRVHKRGMPRHRFDSVHDARRASRTRPRTADRPADTRQVADVATRARAAADAIAGCPSRDTRRGSLGLGECSGAACRSAPRQDMHRRKRYKPARNRSRRRCRRRVPPPERPQWPDWFRSVWKCACGRASNRETMGLHRHSMQLSAGDCAPTRVRSPARVTVRVT